MGVGTSHYILLGHCFNVYYYIPFHFDFYQKGFLEGHICCNGQRICYSSTSKELYHVVCRHHEHKTSRPTASLWELFEMSDTFSFLTKTGWWSGKGRNTSRLSLVYARAICNQCSSPWEFVSLLRLFGILVAPSYINHAVSLYNFAAPTCSFKNSQHSGFSLSWNDFTQFSLVFYAETQH